jgi:hypothetical protein
MTLLSSRTTTLGRVDRAGSGGLIAGMDVAMGRVGRHAGVGVFLGPVPPSKPILSRAEEDCPHALYFGVGGGVCNETQSKGYKE